MSRGRAWAPAVVTVVGTACLLVACFLAARAADVSATGLVRDVSTSTGSPWYLGSLSVAGAIVWASSSAIALFAAARTSGDDRRALLGLGTLGLVMALDDALLFHEGMLPALLGRESAELLLYGVYGIAGGWLALRYWRRVRPVGRPFGVLLVLLFAASGVMDVVDLPRLFVEDALKLGGIVCWAGLAITQAAAVVPATPVQPPVRSR